MRPRAAVFARILGGPATPRPVWVMIPTSTYRIPLRAAEQRRKKVIVQSVIVALLTFLAPILVTELRHFHREGWGPWDGTMILIIACAFVFLGALLAWAIWRAVHKGRAIADQQLSVEIVIDQNSVTRREGNGAETRIPFADVTRMEERPGGFRVCAKNPPLQIWVLKDLEGYEELKMRILGASRLDSISKRGWLSWEMTSVAGFLASLLILLFVDRLLYVRAAALYATLFLSVGTWQILRHRKSQARQNPAWVLGLSILLLFILARAIPLWPF